MDTVKAKMDLLKQIQNAVTDSYLQSTSLTDLQAKINEIDDIVKQ